MARAHSKVKDVADFLIRNIASGAYKAGENIPPVRELAARFDTCAPVVHSALNVLEGRDLIIRKPRSGVLVKPQVIGDSERNTGRVLICVPTARNVFCRIFSSMLGSMTAERYANMRPIFDDYLLTPIGTIYNDMFQLLSAKLNDAGLLPIVVEHDLLYEKTPDPRLLQTVKKTLATDLQAVIIFGKNYVALPLLEDFPQNRIVFICEMDYPGIPGNGVLWDFEQAFYEMTAHLARLGRRRILFSVSEPRHFDRTEFWQGQQHHFVAAYGGYERALREFGLASYNVKMTGFYGPSVTPELLQSIMRGSNPPDAVMCHMDTCAIYFVRAAMKLGIRVPEDLAITGFFNTPWSEYSPVRLSTIGFDMEQLTSEAVRLAANPPAERQVVYLKPQLIVKDSCGGSSEAGNISSKRKEKEKERKDV